MRCGRAWCVVLLLVAGCGGAPAGRSAGDRTVSAATTPAAARDSARPAALPDQLSAADARRFLAAHPEALVLDVRNPDEWNDDLGHIEGAHQIPLPELASRLGEIARWKDRAIVVVCRVGGRSRTATDLLRSAGYSQAVNMEGGMQAWRADEKAVGH